MTQKNPPGYPLPDGELGEDEIVCQLIYLPDRPEYWRALLAAIHYMSTWRAWERDIDKRGKDAAANWRAAFELTIGCWRMTCLEDLTTAVQEILDTLQTKKDCCDDNITYLPVEPVTTDIVPDEGDPPEFYGETEVIDWDDWKEHVCHNAHAYVDYLAHAGDTLNETARYSAVTLGVIAALMVLLAASGLIFPMSFAAIAAIVGGLGILGTTTTFLGSEEAILEARTAIVCAILSGSGLAEAVEDALGSGLDWDLFYQWVLYDDALAIIYEGGIGEQYLPADKRDDCECEDVGVFAVGGNGATCATFDKEGEYRFPAVGLANLWTTYVHDHICNDLGYLGSVGRVSLFDEEGEKATHDIEMWITDYSTAGGISGQYPDAVMFHNPVPPWEILYVPHGEFVEGFHYVVENVHKFEVIAGESGSATINWKFRNI